jgi:hypothetical protein
MTPRFLRCYGYRMSALKDRILNSSLDELVAAAERGEIDPDEVWAEVLASLDRSLETLREMNRLRERDVDRIDYAELERRQDRIDAMIAEWRSEIEAAGLLPAGDDTQPGRASRASHGG